MARPAATNEGRAMLAKYQMRAGNNPITNPVIGNSVIASVSLLSSEILSLRKSGRGMREKNEMQSAKCSS